MAKRTILVLEDGAVYEGATFGAELSGYGEVVFNTSMIGYQEMLTDPSYAGPLQRSVFPVLSQLILPVLLWRPWLMGLRPILFNPYLNTVERNRLETGCCHYYHQ